jgi:hypothetical protein
MLDKFVSWTGRYADFRNIGSFIEDEKGGGPLRESVPIILYAQSISFASLFLAFLAGSLLPVQQPPFPLWQAFIGFFILIIAGGTLVFYMSAGLFFLVSKLFGGSGSLSAQTRLLALITACANILAAPFSFLLVLISQVPALSAASLLIRGALLLLGFYQLYAFYVTIEKVHSLSWLRAAGAVVFSIALAFVAMGLLSVALFKI